VLFESNVKKLSTTDVAAKATLLKRREIELINTEEKRNYCIKTFDTFLSSSLSNELVYIILHGICQFTLLNFIKSELSPEQIERF